MSDRPVSEFTLTDVAEFHQQLLRLHAAGLNLQLDNGTVASSLAERLNEIMAGLAIRAGSATSLADVVSQADFIPDRYRLGLETWTKCDRSVEALAVLRAPVQLASQRQADMRFALLLPSIILILIYCASFYLLQVTVPRMEAIYTQLDSPPSQAVRWLIAVRSAMPYWVPGVPLLVGAGLVHADLTGRLALPNWLLGPRASQQISRFIATGAQPGHPNRSNHSGATNKKSRVSKYGLRATHAAMGACDWS